MSQTSWGEIEDLLLTAHERRGHDCEQFVQLHCHDPILRETITALLKRTGTSADPLAGAVLPGPDDASAVAAGTRVGPYMVLHRLGRGGMGEVFLARDSRLDRAVALKCLVSSDVTPQELRDRVIREARLAAQINHPHVAAVHDVLDEERKTFIVMEYAEGESLAVLLKRGPLPGGRVTQLGLQLASALGAAHRVGIIHRDLKPANVQVTPDGSVKVLDFGIATAYAAAMSTTQTGPGVAVALAPAARAGTPGYMSPEQILGREVDERSDIFSASVVLFEMATGRRPVESSDPLDVLLATVRVLPRADALGRVVDEGLADVIARGLASDPRNRFQTAGELAAALEALQRAAVTPAISWSRTLRPVAFAAFLPVLVWTLGRISSAGYNTTLGRTGGFAVESALDHFTWGARSMVAPAVYGALALILLWTIKFLLRLASLLPPAERRIASVLRTSRHAAERMALYDPAVLAQALAGLGLAALLAVAWRFNDLILAWGVRVSSGPTDARALLPLSPDNEGERAFYRAVLTVLLLLFAAGLWRVIQLRARLGTRRGTGGMIALAAVVAALLFLMEIPYRIFSHSSAAVVQFGGLRCYAIGEDPTRWLLYCPSAAPPRNRIVDKTDPAVRFVGVVEEIFTPTVSVR